MLLMSALGTGIFTLHHFFDQIGIVMGLVILFTVMIMFIFSSDFLVFALRKNDDARSLNKLVKKCLGVTWMVIFDILFFIYLFLVTISVVLTVSKTIYTNFGHWIMEDWFKYSFVDEDDFLNHFEDFNRYSAYMIGFIFYFLAIQRDIQKFKYISLFSFLIYIIIILIIFIQFPAYY